MPLTEEGKRVGLEFRMCRGLTKRSFQRRNHLQYSALSTDRSKNVG